MIRTDQHVRNTENQKYHQQLGKRDENWDQAELKKSKWVSNELGATMTARGDHTQKQTKSTTHKNLSWRWHVHANKNIKQRMSGYATVHDRAGHVYEGPMGNREIAYFVPLMIVTLVTMIFFNLL